MYVPFSVCPYPEVFPETLAQYAGAGMGDYLAPFSFPIPQALAAGNPRGLGCAGGCGCGCGVGAVGDGTGVMGTGLFASADPGSWGAGEFAALAAGVLLLYGMVRTTNRVERSYRRTSSRVTGKVRKVKSGFRRRKEAAGTVFTGK